MTMRTIFVPCWAGSTSEAPLETALAVARRVEAHLDVVYVQPGEAQVAALLRAAALGPVGTPEQTVQRNHLATEEARDRFASWRQRHALLDGIVGGRTRSVFDAVRRLSPAGPVILVRRDTATMDIKGMALASGILTASGGRTSHAAVMTRQLGRVCLAAIALWRRAVAA